MSSMEEYCLLPIHDDILLPFAVISVQLDLDHSNSEALLSYLSKGTSNDAIVAVFPVRTDTSARSQRVSYLGTVGVLGQVLQMSRLPGVRQATLVVEGRHRLSIGEVRQRNGLLKVTATRLPSQDDVHVDATARQGLIDRTRRLMDFMALKGREEVVRKILTSLEQMSAGDAADSIGSVLATSLKEKETLLNETSSATRVVLVSEMVQKSIELVEKAMSVRKQHHLKPARINIQSKDEISDLLDKIQKKSPPKEVIDAALSEVKKLQRTNEMHPSYGMSRTYLETLAAVPFNQYTPEAQDNIEHAKAELDTGHFGLQNAKQRILEYVAVQKLSNRAVRGPILCFVGPPGVGKTSLAKGMSKALGKKYVRVSLGGVRDEAEIRGHRRTYIGSMPGRIISGLCQIGVSDCVMLLDEIDKMGHDIRGNPAAALLEVLDPEQNHSFVDTYLGVPVDLSRVTFLATANSLSELPAALLDRLEVIELSGYTIQEKINIAQKHLIPKVIGENGLTPMLLSGKLEFPVSGLEYIIKNHTMEVGVRGLERCLSSICRHCATNIVKQMESDGAGIRELSKPFTRTNNLDRSNKTTGGFPERRIQWNFSPSTKLSSVVSPFLLRETSRSSEITTAISNADVKNSVNLRSVEKIIVDQGLIEVVLGPSKHPVQSPEDHFEGAGVAAGLVWTPFGGSLQYIECCVTNRGNPDHQGQLTLTGQLGEVLEESAQIAMSWIRSHAVELGFSQGYAFQNADVHVHLPSGGIQKDGPSAGITLAVALISLFSGRRVRSDTAMTGELSLTGLVLPIGGLKEKLVAAQQTGMKRVIIPKANERDLKHNVPEEVRNALEIYKATRLDDVLLLAFDPPFIVHKLSKL